MKQERNGTVHIALWFYLFIQNNFAYVVLFAIHCNMDAIFQLYHVYSERRARNIIVFSIAQV